MKSAGDVFLSTEGIQLGDILGRESEVENLAVALDAGWRQRLGKHYIPPRGVPIEKDLGRRLAVLFGDGANDFILELVAAGQRGVGLDEDVVLVAEFNEVLPLAEGVNLNLVDNGDDGAVLKQVLHVALAEVGDPDRADLTRPLSILEGPPALEALVFAVGRGVDEVEVEIREVELPQGLVEGFGGVVVAVVGIPELARNEDLVPRCMSIGQPPVDGTAASFFVHVSRSRVDVAIPCVESG